MRSSRFFFLFIVSLLGACSTWDRKPASEVVAGNDSIESLYNAKMDLDLLQDRVRLEKRTTPQTQSSGESNPDYEKIRALENQLIAREADLAARASAQAGSLIRLNRSGGTEPFSVFGYNHRKLGQHSEKIVLHDLSPYLVTENHPSKYFAMNFHQAENYELHIENEYFSKFLKRPNPSQERDSNGSQPYLDGSISCDAPFAFKDGFFKKQHPGPSQVRFRMFDTSWNGQRIVIYPSAQVTECRLFFKNSEEPSKIYGLRLLPDTQAFDLRDMSYDLIDGCVLPDASALTPVEQFFLTAQYNSMTCPQKISAIRTLEEPWDGVNAKMEALLGQPLPREAFEKQNPRYPLDFSKAPKLDEILISYLVYRHDFYGSMIARALEHHAKQGTRIRIMVSDVIQLDKDRDLLYGLVQKYSNVQLQEYKWDSPSGSSLDEKISELHKTLHVKLFLTLSANDPAANVAVIGGRNIHDGFVFKTVPDYSAYPELDQYGKGKGKDENFIHWRDFEVAVRDRAFVQRIAAHYNTLWDRDSRTFFMRSLNINIPSGQKVSPNYFNSDQLLVRHFISTPYKDDQALENLFAQMIDSAQKTLFISTPYFRPTKKLGEAFERAIKRGVKIQLITRINLDGDTADFILSDVNKAGINRFYKNMSIYEYTEPKVILHSKIVLVDGKLSMVGSVNLNQRSFIHDLENSMMIYSPAFHQRMEKILMTYQKNSRQVVEKQKIKLVNKILLGIPIVKEAL